MPKGAPSSRELSEKLTEGVRLRFYTYKQCFESQRCDLLLPAAVRQPPPSKREVFFDYLTTDAQNGIVYKMTTAMWADCPIK